MSVYIPGMEMPKSCNCCRFAVDGWCYAFGKPNIEALANEGHTNFCPLVPVPDHGDLIDRVEFRREMDKNYPFDKFTQSKHGEADDAKRAIIQMLANAPTIIPADGKGTDVPTREEANE